jgi:hypothetical protein
MTHRIHKLAIAASTIALGLMLTTAPDSAQAKKGDEGGRGSEEWFQYVAQFNCGHDAGSGPVRVVPGFYATALNLYNPNPGAVTLRKNLALTFPPEEQATGEVSDQIEEVIDPGTALQVDCGEIQNEFVFPNPPPATIHLQGFLVIESNKALHVEAVYTSSGFTGDVSIDTQRIAERKVNPRPLVSKVKICHFPPGNPGNAHEIIIDASALSAHQAHGDTLGECDDDDQGEDED